MPNPCRAFAAALAIGAFAVCTSCTTDNPPAVSVVATTPAHTFVTLSPTAAPTTSHARGRQGWSGNGVFSVGTVHGGAKASIPAGRYTVELMAGETGGFWIRCTDLPCSLTSGNQVDIGNADGVGFTTVVDVLPTDGAVFLYGVSFYVP